MVTILLGEDTQHALKDVSVGRASAFEAMVVGVQDNYENVEVHFGANGDVNTNAVVCNPKSGGRWYCYANGAFFPAVGKNHFHVTAKTPQGDSAYLGSGTLWVTQSVLNQNAGDTPALPDDCYVRGLNGLYYKLTVDFDENGIPFPVLDNQGISR
jgi:hypothetical protein